MKVLRKNAKTIEAAIELALAELGLKRDQVEVTVIEQPSKGVLFGIGAKDAVIEVSYDDTINNTADDTTENTENTENAKNIEAAKVAAVAAVTAEAAKTTADTETVEAEEITETKTAASDNNPGEDAIKFLTPVFESLKISPEYEITERDSIHWVTFQGKGLGVLIGRRGETLDALQYLTNLAVNRQFEEKNRIVLDVEGYRAARAETLTNLAKKMANKARRSHRDMMLEPMSPHERRVIHMALQNEEDVRTVSVGEEPYRKVIIKLNNPDEESYGNRGGRGYNRGGNRRGNHNRGYNKNHNQNYNHESRTNEDTSAE